MCDFGEGIEIIISRRISVDKCIAPIVSRLNAAGVYTTGSCCGHGKSVASVTIQPSSAHRARSLGLTVRWDLAPPGACPVIELIGVNLAMIEAMPLQGAQAAPAP
jgi:hypothetical protein